jgi:hypothetical protein
VDEIVSANGVIPPLPGFASPFGESQSDEGMLSIHRERLAKRLLLLSNLFPILAGVALAAAERALAPDALTLIAHAAAWSVGAIVIFWAAYEVMVGLERRRLLNQLPGTRRQDSYFAGLSTAAEPRYYQGLYHYDLGLVRIDGGSLRFAGTRGSFSLGNSEARRVWLASGPRHWTPRKIICVEYQMDGGKTGIVALQSLERWFWPGTSAAAQDLLAALTKWSKNGEPTGSPASPPPQIGGAVAPRVGLGAVWKSLRVSCLVSLCAGWYIVHMMPFDPEEFLTPFAAPLVSAALVLFILAPHVEWSRARGAQSPAAQPHNKARIGSSA